MNKYLSLTLALLLIMGALAGCAGGTNASEQRMASNTSTPTSTPPEDMPNTSFSKEDYEKLSDLQFDDYRHMTVSEFQNKVWERTDTPEYSELLSHLTKDEALYALRDSDETAAFLYYVLEPLTKENWQTHTYNGVASSDFPAGEDNARLEYTYTLTILDAAKIKVKDYCDVRVGIKEAMDSMMLGRMKEQLQSEEYMGAELKTFVEGILPDYQTPELSVTIEYAYFPLPKAEENHQSTGSANDADQEGQRTTPHGTESDYKSLLALKTVDYQDMSLADFNAALLAWADADHERSARLEDDDRYDDFNVSLSEDERSFIEWTVFLSGHENAQAVRSAYTKGPENDPWYDQYLPVRFGASVGKSGYCSLYYQFSWHISDKEAVTVGERDRQIRGMIKAVQDFWNETDTEELLKMNEADIVAKLQEIMGAYSTGNITITTSGDDVQFENIK